MDSSNLAKLREIFTIVMELDEGEQAEALDRANFDNWRSSVLEKWDSLAHVSLIAAIESEFSITLDSTDSERMTSFKGIELLLSEKGL